jgi:NADH dehydrogenase
MLELLEMLKTILHRRGRNVRVPMALMRPMAKMLHRMPSFPVTPDQLLMLEEDNTGDPRPFYGTFGLAPMPLAQGLRQVLD